MKILALDFSGPQRSAAACTFDTTRPLDGERVQRQDLESLARSGQVLATAAETGRAGLPFTLIHGVLEEAGLDKSDVGQIAVGTGPGSYTGIRAAIAIAQGWQLAAGLPVVGVPTVQALAMGLWMGGHRGLGGVAIDAQRGEFYCSAWLFGDEGYTLAEPLRIVGRDAVEPRMDWIAGPGLSQWFPKAIDIEASAACIGRLAAGRPGGDAAAIEPVYMRQTAFVKAAPPRDFGPGMNEEAG